MNRRIKVKKMSKKVYSFEELSKQGKPGDMIFVDSHGGGKATLARRSATGTSTVMMTGSGKTMMSADVISTLVNEGQKQ